MNAADLELLRKLVDETKEYDSTHPVNGGHAVSEDQHIAELTRKCLPALSRLLEAPAQAPGWIPCSERMPEDYDRVITYSPSNNGVGGGCQICVWHLPKKKFLSWETRKEHSDFTPVTHWMPLPAPPASPGEGT